MEQTNNNCDVASDETLGTGFLEFAERHARAASTDFARASVQYSVSTNCQILDHKDLLKKFVECFSENFENEYRRRSAGNGTAAASEGSDYSEDQDSPKIQKPFFRRLSFKGLRKGKAFFHKQHSDDGDTSNSRQNKTKLAKIVVECRKEGTVNYIPPESLDQPSAPHKWEKCKLVLIKTIGGYMLEFYSPPKAPKPRSGVFCFLISEARETTALEMPDHENTFVLKADNNMEYVIEAKDAVDMRSWLATIRYCMKSTPTSQMPSIADASTISSLPNTSLISSTGSVDLATGGPTTSANANNTNTTNAGATLNNNNVNSTNNNQLATLPELPPRRPDDRISSSSNFELTENDLQHAPETDLTNMMREYPWFHSTLPRADASTFVLQGGASSHGVFLVRQSETRKGEFVLTFNFQGRAKHLRMTLNDLGQCRVQHLWFPTITEMLEHFRQNSIPLEQGGVADVRLTEYIVHQTNQLQSPRHQTVITMHGSVRIRTADLDLMQMAQEASEGSRAVDNQYSFV
ncbi:unnamed protein product [Diamesa hyperborea]